VSGVAAAWGAVEQHGDDRWRRQRRLPQAITVLFALVCLAALARAVALGNRLSVLDDTDSRAFVGHARDADSFVRTTTLVLALVALVLAPCFIVWLWRAAKNQQALGRRPERLGAGWAIGGWFLPLANLVLPVLVTQDLWRGSNTAIAPDDPRWRIADRSWLVGWWWGLFLAALLTFSGADADGSTRSLSQTRGSNLLALFAMLAATAAAALGVLVVRRLDERQEACHVAR
jgi:membrane protease YdiL (CAAX protease family)